MPTGSLARDHPVIGERILRTIPGMGAVARIVRHEHERYDGGGYPDGLAGEQIPIGSRVILACDAYHAMTSDRPYRGAMDHRDAVVELARAAGTQFDLHVVAALLGRLADGTLAADGALRSARRRADRHSSRRSGRRSTPCQQNSIARSTSTSRGTSWWSCHHVATDCTAPDSSCAWISIWQLALGRVERVAHRRLGVGRDETRDDRRGLTLDRADALRHVGVGRVAEEHAPRLAVLLDEAQERLRGPAGARRPRRARRSPRRRKISETLAGAVRACSRA